MGHMLLEIAAVWWEAVGERFHMLSPVCSFANYSKCLGQNQPRSLYGRPVASGVQEVALCSVGYLAVVFSECIICTGSKSWRMSAVSYLTFNAPSYPSSFFAHSWYV